MCRIFIKPTLLFILICSSSSHIQKSFGQISLIDSIINHSSLERLVNYLGSDSLQGRFTGTVHARIAAQYIAEEFIKAGTSPLEGNDGYLMPFDIGTEPQRSGFNVVAALPGKNKAGELIIISAHYDHIGTASINPHRIFRKNGHSRKGDSIFNGANDNASGVAAVISLAHYFGKVNNNERTIVFIAFSGEELGLLGSQHVALFINPASVKAVINIEMIGRSISRKKKSAFITGSLFSNFQKLLNKKLVEKSPTIFGKNFFKHDPFPDERLFFRSDNYWFARKGIPAHTIMASSPKDVYYHSPGDEFSTLDFSLMTHLVQAIAISCTGLIDGTETPSRIQPDHIEDR